MYQRVLLREGLIRRLFGVALGCLALAAPAGAGQGQGQGPPPTGFGAPCAPGQYSLTGYLMVCSDAGGFRYAMPEDMPPAPEGGYVSRPAWYPRITEMFRSINPPKCPVGGRVTFTSPPVRLNDLSITVPQGAMVGDHVTPIDHGYIGVRPLDKPQAARTEADYVTVYAPADGEVIEISLLGIPTSIRIVFAHGCDTYSVFMVINRLSGALGYLQNDLMAQGRLNPFVQLLAGEEFAVQRDNPIDFSVHDGASWLRGFVAPFSYAEGEAWKPFTVDPWSYFAPDLSDAYQASMQRVVAPRWGRIDQDVPGTAAGNWFLDGTLGYSGRSVETFRSATGTLSGGNADGKNTYAWSHLSVARHWVEPLKWIFSIGWWKDQRGDPGQWLIDVPSGLPDPSQLTAASGVAVYRLQRPMFTAPHEGNAPLPIGYETVAGPTEGIVAMQVNADGTLMIEVVPGVQDPASFAGFTAARRTYRR